MYELSHMSPGGYHYRHRFDTLDAAMREAHVFWLDCDADIIDISHEKIGARWDADAILDYWDERGISDSRVTG